MIKAVIFDSDGMLSHGPRFSEVYAKEQNIPLSELTPFFTGSFKECLIGKADLKEELKKGWLKKWKWEGSVESFIDYWFSVGDKLDKNVFDSVKKIKSGNIPCVLATNQEKYRTEYLSKKFGYENTFDKIFSSAYVGYKKPSADFFQVIFDYLSRLSLFSKENVLFWDDDLENVKGAKNFGFQAEIFTDFKSYEAVMKKFGLL